MRIHKKTIKGLKVEAYNDSNIEWVVQVEGRGAQRFDKRKWSMNEAILFAVSLY